MARGKVFLDMACGRGEYSLAASKIVGDEGAVRAVDLWEEGISSLKKEAAAQGIRNISAAVGDVSRRLPLEDDSVDVCLMATVIHEFSRTRAVSAALEEGARVLKSGGTLAVIEFKKMEGPPGPPLHIRLSPDDLEALVSPYGFSRTGIIEAGPFNYMATFRLP